MPLPYDSVDTGYAYYKAWRGFIRTENKNDYACMWISKHYNSALISYIRNVFLQTTAQLVPVVPVVILLLKGVGGSFASLHPWLKYR